jgi:uncharacterized protein YndB with AHSA1/START domain
MSDALAVRVTSRIAAPPARVFAAWVNPQSVERWMLAPAAGEMVKVEIDPREGGEFCFVVRRGGEEIEHAGVYLAFERPKMLVFTWMVPRYSKDLTRVTIQMAAAGSGTQVSLTQDGVPPDYEAQTRAGWSAILEAIAAVATA